jgi:hypothetical protein
MSEKAGLSWRHGGARSSGLAHYIPFAVMQADLVFLVPIFLLRVVYPFGRWVDQAG